MIAYCPACGAKLDANVKFCGECGADLEEYSYTKKTTVEITLDNVRKVVNKVEFILYSASGIHPETIGYIEVAQPQPLSIKLKPGDYNLWAKSDESSTPSGGISFSTKGNELISFRCSTYGNASGSSWLTPYKLFFEFDVPAGSNRNLEWKRL